MKTQIAVLVIVTTLLAGSFADAQVASFECSNARTPTEHAICQHRELGAQDVRMATYYEILMLAPPAAEGMAYREFRERLHDEQVQWQRETRDGCGAQIACLTDAYARRIDTLRDLARRMLPLTFNAASASGETAIDAGSTKYALEENMIWLTGSKSEQAAAPGSAANHVTKLPGPTAIGKLDNQRGMAVFLRDSLGGSGTFIYVAVAVGNDHGSNAILLGDRIEPQAMSLEQGVTTAKCLGRPRQAPTCVKPSVVVVRRFRPVHGHIVPLNLS